MLSCADHSMSRLPLSTQSHGVLGSARSPRSSTLAYEPSRTWTQCPSRSGSARWRSRTAASCAAANRSRRAGDEEVDIRVDVARPEREGTLQVHTCQGAAQRPVSCLGQVREDAGQQVRLGVVELQAQAVENLGLHEHHRTRNWRASETEILSDVRKGGADEDDHDDEDGGHGSHSTRPSPAPTPPKVLVRWNTCTGAQSAAVRSAQESETVMRLVSRFQSRTSNGEGRIRHLRARPSTKGRTMTDYVVMFPADNERRARVRDRRRPSGHLRHRLRVRPAARGAWRRRHRRCRAHPQPTGAHDQAGSERQRPGDRRSLRGVRRATVGLLHRHLRRLLRPRRGRPDPDPGAPGRGDPPGSGVLTGPEPRRRPARGSRVTGTHAG